MAFIGNTVQTQGFVPATDYFSGNGSTTAFTLSRPVASVQQVVAVISNVVQDPATAYTVSGNTLTFTSAPPSGTNNIYVRYTSLITQVIAPSQGTVGNTQFSSSTTSIPFAVGGPLGGGNSSIMKNRIINGAMVIDQRNAGASVTITTAEEFTTDRWQFAPSASSKLTAQQSTTAPVGFNNSLLLTSSAATSVGAGDYYFLGQKIEGFNFADCGWGTADAKTVTLSFWCRSSVTGTYGGALVNSAQNRSYPFSYTVSVANTWEQKSITIAGDTTGTWIGATNGVGVRLRLGFGIGSTYSGTAGAWAASNYMAPTGSTNWISTSGATFYITGVQLEVGSSATGYEYRQYGQELALCQRYYEVGSAKSFVGGATAGGIAISSIFKLTKRSSPTMAYSTAGSRAYVPTSTEWNETESFGVFRAGTNEIAFVWTATAEL